MQTIRTTCSADLRCQRSCRHELANQMITEQSGGVETHTKEYDAWALEHPFDAKAEP